MANQDLTLEEQKKKLNVAKPASNLPYIIAVIFMMIIGTAGSIVLTLLQPNHDNTPLVAAIFGFLTPTTLSLLAFMKSQETHLSVNSRLDEFMKSAQAASRAEGQLQGRNEAYARTDRLEEIKGGEHNGSQSDDSFIKE